MARLLPCEWRKAVGLVSGEKNVRQGPTSNRTSRPPVDESALAAEYGLIRAWLTAVLVALEDPERVRGWGGRVIAVRLVLLALGQAAMVSGSSVLEFGCRNLALHAALSHRTVARVLKLLRNEPDPLVDLVSRRQAARADATSSGSRPLMPRAPGGGGDARAGSPRSTRRSWCSAGRPGSSTRCSTAPRPAAPRWPGRPG